MINLRLTAKRSVRIYGGILFFCLLLIAIIVLNVPYLLRKPSHTLNVRSTDNVVVRVAKDQPSFPMDDIADIKQGETSSLLLTKDGRLYASGHNDYGQLGIGNTGGEQPEYVHINVAGNPKFTKIDMTHRHAIAMTRTGDVYTWGMNISGQIGNGTRQTVNKPTKVFSGAADVAAGYRFSAVVRKNGSLWAWGMQCDPGTPGLEELEEKFDADVSNGGSYYDGRSQSTDVYCLEEENLPLDSITPRHIESPIHFTAVSGGYGSILLLDDKQNAYGYGCNAWGQLGRGHFRNDSGTRQIARIDFPQGVKIRQLDAGFRQGIALDTQDRVWSWGHDERGDPIKYKANRTDKPEIITDAPKAVTRVQAGHDEAGVLAGGSFYAFGDNQVSQISRKAGEKRQYILQSFVKTDDGATGINNFSLGYDRNLYWSDKD